MVVAAGEEALPYADLDGPADRRARARPSSPPNATARRLAAGSADHFTGHGARQVLDAHPARLADLLMDRARRHLLRPVAALAQGRRALAAVAVRPADACTGAARRLARTPYRTGLEAAADRLLDANRPFDGAADGAAGRVARRAHLVAARARRRAG